MGVWVLALASMAAGPPPAYRVCSREQLSLFSDFYGVISTNCPRYLKGTIMNAPLKTPEAETLSLETALVGLNATLSPVSQDVAPESNRYSNGIVIDTAFDFTKFAMDTRQGVLDATAALASQMGSLANASATRRLEVAKLVFGATVTKVITTKETAGCLTVKDVYERFVSEAGDASKVQNVSKLTVFHKLAKVNADKRAMWGMVEETARNVVKGSKYEAVLTVARAAIDKNMVLGGNSIAEALVPKIAAVKADPTHAALKAIVDKLGKLVADDELKMTSLYFATILATAKEQLATHEATVAAAAEEGAEAPKEEIPSFEF